MSADAPVTLITGASRGIGRALAAHYAAQGHAVVGCSRGKIDWKLEGFTHVQADVCDEKQVLALFSRIGKEHGRLDHLVNNAGVAAMNHFTLTPMETVRRVLDVNVAGTFLFCREAARLMQKRGFGRIVNMGTVAVALKLEGEAIYAASKAAVLSLTQVLAKEIAPFGVTVNAVCPTPIETDLIKNVPKEKLDKLLERQAIRRYGTFADVANAVDFFLKPESAFVTGQALFLGGV